MMAKSTDDEVELCNMFRNLLRHGLIERQDLIQGGHTDTAASLMLSRPALSIEQRDKEEAQGILRGFSSRPGRHGGYDAAGRTKKTLRETPAPCEEEEAAALAVEECKRLKPRRNCPAHEQVDDFEDDCGAPAVVVRTSAGAWSNADEEAILLAFRSEGALVVEQREKKHDEEQEEDDYSYYHRLRMTEGEM